MAATVPLNTAWLLRQLLLVVLFSVTSAINALAITSADNNAMPTSLDIDNAGPMSMLIDMQLERFRLRDICNAQTNRNLRLYMDYGDTGFVRGIARDRRVERPPNGAEVSDLIEWYVGSRVQPSADGCHCTTFSGGWFT